MSNDKRPLDLTDPFWQHVVQPMCGGKHPFPDRRTAQEVCTRTNRRKDQRLSPYRCPHCDKWHTGTTSTSPGKFAHAKHSLND